MRGQTGRLLATAAIIAALIVGVALTSTTQAQTGQAPEPPDPQEPTEQREIIIERGTDGKTEAESDAPRRDDEQAEESKQADESEQAEESKQADESKQAEESKQAKKAAREAAETTRKAARKAEKAADSPADGRQAARKTGKTPRKTPPAEGPPQKKDEDDAPLVDTLRHQTAADGYLHAHRNQQDAPALLGSGMTVTVEQSIGDVKVALPDKRSLDPDVFGSAQHPRQIDGSPGMTGVPPNQRANGRDGATLKSMSPFGDAAATLGSGKLSLKAIDRTATDVAPGASSDALAMKATWKDAEGNVYGVRCCESLVTVGLEFPTFGGVVTNHLVHGWTGVGTPLLPTAFAYTAFWGTGEVTKNGQVVDGKRLIHGMLTEAIRGENFELAADHQVNPSRVQFHLLVPPYEANEAEGTYEKAPVNTRYELDNGGHLPFWHVMFDNLKVSAER